MINAEYIPDSALLKLQNEELRLFRLFKEYCEKHEINYYLAFGTLLGAVRHGGFIPWDDDVDLLIARPDYDRLFEAIKSDPPTEFGVYSYKDASIEDTNLSYQCKITSPNMKILREVGDKIEEQQVWIDLFTIDGMPDNYILRTVHLWKIQAALTRIRIARSSRQGSMPNKKRRMLERIAIILLRLIPVGKLFSIKNSVDHLHSVLSKYPIRKNGPVIGYAPEYGEKCVTQWDNFGDGKEILFEGVLARVPVNSEKLLSTWYGEWRLLPPIEKRKPKHSFQVVDM